MSWLKTFKSNDWQTWDFSGIMGILCVIERIKTQHKKGKTIDDNLQCVVTVKIHPEANNGQDTVLCQKQPSTERWSWKNRTSKIFIKKSKS